MGSLPPCGIAAIGDGLAFRDLPLAVTVVPYAKQFKILPFAGTNSGSCAIPSRTGVVPVFPTSARFEPKLPQFCTVAKVCSQK